MNILLLYSSLFDKTNSFYWFYKQLVENLPDSQLFFSYLRNERNCSVENSFQLPDTFKYYTSRNINALSSYIRENRISVLFNFYLPIWEIKCFFRALKKKIPGLKFVELIHNCPNHSLQLKRYILLNTNVGFIPFSIKYTIEKILPRLYIFFLREKLRKENQQAYQLHDAIILLSPSYIPEYLSLIKKNKSQKVFAIPNPLAPVHFCHSVVPVDRKAKRIVFCGRFEIEKAIPLLLSIWSGIQEQVPDWEFHLIGEGSQMSFCKELSVKLNLKRIKFLGYKNSRPLIDHASILCLTSVIEGFPTVFLEAMQMGVIPIGFDSFSAIYDMIDNWENGVIIPAYNIDLYKDSLLKLMLDGKKRVEMGKKAQVKVEKYRISNIVPLWNSVFKEIGVL